MSSTESKQLIMNSLSELDKTQSEKVINYISSLLTNEENSYSRFKAKALIQIDKALKEA